MDGDGVESLQSALQDKLSYFRVKELKEVLTQLGLPKQGRKQDLADRVLASLSDERGLLAKKNAVRKDEVAKVVDDTYSVYGAANLASKAQGFSDSVNVKSKEAVVDSYQMDKIRCLCGSPQPTDSMIKCEDPRCNVWQHIACVVIPEKPEEGLLPSPPEIFYCESCRLNLADPFWKTVAHPLYPAKSKITNVPVDGSNPVLSIENTFHLTRADKDLLLKQEYDVQAWCMLLNDKVPFRMQWPQYADLQVNGVPVRAMNRSGSQLLGANGRDDGPIITQCTRDGINKISLTGCDARIFCVGVRIVNRRTLHQILSLIPKEAEGECFEDALVRVRRCIGGGATTENADHDRDIEVVADSVPVNLRCPHEWFKNEGGWKVQALHTHGLFRSGSVCGNEPTLQEDWQCPVCLKNYSWEKIIIDPYFNQITSKLRDFGEDAAEVEVKTDGSWRVKADYHGTGLGNLGLWHLPDGTLCDSSKIDLLSKPELKPDQHEAGCDNLAALKLGIKKNRNGCWEFSKPIESNGPNIIAMSSSATDSGIDCEDASVNQDAGFNDPFTAATAGNTEVIVLSDSEEDTEQLMSYGPVRENKTSILPVTDGSRTGKTSRGRSDSSSSFLHQERCVKPRVYLSIDSD
ncbi:SUMO ligase siz1 [Orobanche minor]